MLKPAAAAILTALLTGLAFGQPAFEVASIKRAVGGGPPGDIPRNMEGSPGHFAMRNVPLRYALEWAYDLKDYELAGPDWIKADDRYDITANAAGPATDAQMKPMLQTLLTERLQMKVHRETRDLAVYALVLAKGAPKLKEAAADGEPSLSGPATGVRFHKFGLSRLTFLLTRRLDRPVLNLTGLEGIYDYTVDLSGLPTPANPNGDPSRASIFTAIQEDLGLKLEARKAPVEILVIDQVSRIPAEN